MRHARAAVLFVSAVALAMTLLGCKSDSEKLAAGALDSVTIPAGLLALDAGYDDVVAIARGLRPQLTDNELRELEGIERAMIAFRTRLGIMGEQTASGIMLQIADIKLAYDVVRPAYTRAWAIYRPHFDRLDPIDLGIVERFDRTARRVDRAMQSLTAGSEGIDYARIAADMLLLVGTVIQVAGH